MAKSFAKQFLKSGIMDVFGVMAFTFALPALALGIINREHINNLEKKLKEFDVIPKEFDSEK